MRKLRWLFGGVVVILALICGGFVLQKPVAIHPQAVQVGDDVNAYLQKVELPFSDVKEGLRKQVVWQFPDHRPTEWAVVYFHGFTSSRMETYPLLEEVAQCLGANLYYSRLQGHGRSDDALREATVSGWTQDAMEGLAVGESIGQKIMVVGTSTGGTLAVWLASAAPESVKELVLLAPNFKMHEALANLLLVPKIELILPYLMGGEYQEWKSTNELRQRYWNLRYPVVALIPMMQLVHRVNQIPFEQIQVPTLFVFSSQDQVVDSVATTKIYQRWGSPQKRLLHVEDSVNPNQHIIAGDILSPNTTERVRDSILNGRACKTL